MSRQFLKKRDLESEKLKIYFENTPTHTYEVCQMSNTEKPEILVNTYGRNAPDAAKFGVGASTLRDVQEAIDARNELSDQQSTEKVGPVRRD